MKTQDRKKKVKFWICKCSLEMAIVGKRQRWRQERAGREVCPHLLLLPMEAWTPFEELLFLLRLIPVGMGIVSSGNSGNNEQLSGSPMASHFFFFFFLEATMASLAMVHKIAKSQTQQK